LLAPLWAMTSLLPAIEVLRPIRVLSHIEAELKVGIFLAHYLRVDDRAVVALHLIVSELPVTTDVGELGTGMG
jgi:hypothetical protein